MTSRCQGLFPPRPKAREKALGTKLQKVNRRARTAEEVVVPSARVMQMSFYTSDSYVNTLNVADFNLISRAIQGDTHRFELIERFIKVRNLV